MSANEKPIILSGGQLAQVPSGSAIGSEFVGFTPAVSGDWESTPTTVNGGLDILADVLTRTGLEISPSSVYWVSPSFTDDAPNRRFSNPKSAYAVMKTKGHVREDWGLMFCYAGAYDTSGFVMDIDYCCILGVSTLAVNFFGLTDCPLTISGINWFDIRNINFFPISNDPVLTASGKSGEAFMGIFWDCSFLVYSQNSGDAGAAKFTTNAKMNFQRCTFYQIDTGGESSLYDIITVDNDAGNIIRFYECFIRGICTINGGMIYTRAGTEVDGSILLNNAASGVASGCNFGALLAQDTVVLNTTGAFQSYNSVYSGAGKIGGVSYYAVRVKVQPTSGISNGNSFTYAIGATAPDYTIFSEVTAVYQYYGVGNKYTIGVNGKVRNLSTKTRTVAVNGAEYSTLKDAGESAISGDLITLESGTYILTEPVVVNDNVNFTSVSGIAASVVIKSVGDIKRLSYDGKTGSTMASGTSVSWTGGTGMVYAIFDADAWMELELLTGVLPTDNVVISDGTNTVTVNGSLRSSGKYGHLFRFPSTYVSNTFKALRFEGSVENQRLMDFKGGTTTINNCEFYKGYLSGNNLTRIFTLNMNDCVFITSVTDNIYVLYESGNYLFHTNLKRNVFNGTIRLFVARGTHTWQNNIFFTTIINPVNTALGNNLVCTDNTFSSNLILSSSHFAGVFAKVSISGNSASLPSSFLTYACAFNANLQWTAFSFAGNILKDNSGGGEGEFACHAGCFTPINSVIADNALATGIYVNPTARECICIETVADINGSLSGKYFLISTTTTNYYVWYNVIGAGSTDPAIAGRIGMRIDCNLNNSAATIAENTYGCLQMTGGDGTTFVSIAPATGSNKINVYNAASGTVTRATTGTSGFIIMRDLTGSSTAGGVYSTAVIKNVGAGSDCFIDLQSAMLSLSASGQKLYLNADQTLTAEIVLPALTELVVDGGSGFNITRASGANLFNITAATGIKFINVDLVGKITVNNAAAAVVLGDYCYLNGMVELTAAASLELDQSKILGDSTNRYCLKINNASTAIAIKNGTSLKGYAGYAAIRWEGANNLVKIDMARRIYNGTVAAGNSPFSLNSVTPNYWSSRTRYNIDPELSGAVNLNPAPLDTFDDTSNGDF